MNISKQIRSIAVNCFDRLPWVFVGLCVRVFNRSGFSQRNFRRLNVGGRTYIDPSVQILGWKNVLIGSETVISEGTWLNINYREHVDRIISIGSNCHIGKRNFFSCGPLIQVKDYCMTSVDCHFLGCGHDISTPMIPYNASGLSPGKPIIIGVNCSFGAAVTVLEGVEIGCGSVIGAGSLVTRNIPPFSLAVGNPCAVVKRFDFSRNRWISIAGWQKELEVDMPSEEQYLSYLKENYSHVGRCLITSGSRFGWL